MLGLVIPGSGLNDAAADLFVLGGGWANAAEDCCGSHGGYGQELANAHVGAFSVRVRNPGQAYIIINYEIKAQCAHLWARHPIKQVDRNGGVLAAVLVRRSSTRTSYTRFRRYALDGMFTRALQQIQAHADAAGDCTWNSSAPTQTQGATHGAEW